MLFCYDGIWVGKRLHSFSVYILGFFLSVLLHIALEHVLADTGALVSRDHQKRIGQKWAGIWHSILMHYVLQYCKILNKRKGHCFWLIFGQPALYSRARDSQQTSFSAMLSLVPCSSSAACRTSHVHSSSQCRICRDDWTCGMSFKSSRSRQHWSGMAS